jgi:archaellum component FlaD/FlaE
MEELTAVDKNPQPEKVRLQKLHRLFEWTNKMVRKYGHDRLEIMIESYRTMGYISDDSYQQVNDIARLMPESLGESHEISSDEFVSELYVLNRILSPSDSSLDRDMIEVLMDMRAGQTTPEESPVKIKNKLGKDEWIDMLDRI